MANPFKAFVARLLVSMCGPFNPIDAYEGPKRRNPVDYEKPTIYRSYRIQGLWVCQSKDADAYGSSPEEAYRL